MARSPSRRQTARRGEIPPWRLWLERHGRKILVVLAIVTVFYLLTLIALTVGLRPAQENTGGLDGCLVTADENPLRGQVRVGDVNAATSEDGCFFFASLPAGSHVVEIEAGGATWQQPVTILAGEAVLLGDISKP